MTTADNGLITVPSAHGVKDTIDRIEQAVKAKAMAAALAALSKQAAAA